MATLLLDLHVGEEKKGPETLKISSALNKYVETSICALFSREYKSLDLTAYDGVVLTGSNYPRLLVNRRVISELIPALRETAESGVPILGICAGHEVIGVSYGYPVKRLETSYYIDDHKIERCEVGWPVVNITEQGQKHFLFRGLGTTIRPAQYHDKSVINVEESEILARNEQCVQAFTPHPYVYGVQFHPEETPESGFRYLLEKSKFTEIAHLFPRPKEYVEWRILKNFVAIVEKKEGAKGF